MKFGNTIETSLAAVSVRPDGIIEIRFRKEQYEVDVKDQQDIESAVLKLTGNKDSSYHILVIPGPYGGITKEAREMEMFESPVYKNQKSIAIVVSSLFQRILGSMYFSLKKNKPNYPYKLLNSEENAVKWILEQKTQSN